MALITCDFFSDELQMGTTITALLPELTAAADGRTERPSNPPVLYLLHGLSDDHTSWQRFSSVGRYADAAGIAVVMPSAGRSFYRDEHHGHRYWSYLTEELPQVVAAYLGLTPSREQCFVAGLSMGGYGALKWALRQPERFAAAASMSGTVDIAAMMRRPDRDGIRDRVFGGDPAPEDDLLQLLDPRVEPRRLRLWVGCGTEDYLYRDNRTFVSAAHQARYDVHTDWRPGGHTWDLWDAMLADVIAWLPGS